MCTTAPSRRTAGLTLMVMYIYIYARAPPSQGSRHAPPLADTVTKSAGLALQDILCFQGVRKRYFV